MVCLVASLGAASAWTQAWNAPVGQPNSITSDGVDIFSASASGLASVGPNGTTLWKTSNIVSSNGSAMKAGKYLFIGEGNDVKALNKTTGAVKWISTAPLGAGQVAKYILVKGAYVLIASNSKLVILNREDGTVQTPVTDFTSTSEPILFGGYLIGGTSSGVQAYQAIMMPDLRISSITKTSNSTTAKIENIGLGNANKVLVKWVVQKTDGTYRTIHISAGTINAGETKNVTITGDFNKGTATVDPYYVISELNENNNERYFS
nr:CARDB domain-containing protein [Methanobacterium bryantii]